MIETLREVRADEYRKLWGRIPRAVGTALCMGEVAFLGWEKGVWLGILTIVALTLLCRVVPSAWWPAERVVDVAYLTVMNSLILRAMWVLLIIDLWLVQDRGLRAIPMVVFLYVIALTLPPVVRHIFGRLARAARLAT